MIKLSKFARDLGVTKATLYNWYRANKLQFHRIGSMNFVDVETYNEFMGIKDIKEQREKGS